LHSFPKIQLESGSILPNAFAIALFTDILFNVKQSTKLSKETLFEIRKYLAISAGHVRRKTTFSKQQKQPKQAYPKFNCKSSSFANYSAITKMLILLCI
jgi:hypothetical protein